MTNIIKTFLILIFFCATTTIYASATIPLRDPFIPITHNLNTLSAPTPLPLESSWISLYFAKAKEVTEFISKKTMSILSPQGKINYDERSNQIWLQDDAQHVAQIRAVIHHLDQPAHQFLIKAKIINIDREYQKKLGFLFHTDESVQNPLTSLTMNTPDNSDNAGEFSVTITKLAENHLLNLQISALEQEGHASLISSPALTTLDNHPAVIESGDEVPYQEATSSGATSVSFKKAVLRLQVTPQYMPNNDILLHIALNQDKVSALTVKGVPAIQTQQITTQVIIKNHQTLVLGGILETTHAKQQQGIPVIDKIPLVGELFKHKHTLTKQQELLIFITPSMLKPLY